MLDNSGAKVVKYKYDAWGKAVSVVGTLTGTLGARNLFRYRGYNYDEETGLYYLRSRYYNPVVGRFVNEDGAIAPEVLSANLFAYCLNSPLSRVDTSGYKGENIFRRAGNWFGDIFSKIGDEIRYQTQIQTEVNILMAKAADEKISAAEDWIEKKVSDVGNTVGGWWNGNAKPWIKQKWADTGAFIKDALHAQQQADILSAQMTYHAASKIDDWVSENWLTATDWITAVGGTGGTLYGVVQALIPVLPAIPVAGQVVLLGASFWGIARLAGWL